MEPTNPPTNTKTHPPPKENQFAETHFLNIGYETSGQGTPLLLLHG